MLEVGGGEGGGRVVEGYEIRIAELLSARNLVPGSISKLASAARRLARVARVCGERDARRAVRNDSYGSTALAEKELSRIGLGR